MTKRKMHFTLSVCSILALLSPTVAQAMPREAAPKAEGASVQAPEGSPEHLALADAYRKKAATYREEASTHRQMLATYKKQVAVPGDSKAGTENPWIKKMRVHCEEYIRDADRLAADADKFAEFHAMRAAELQGR